MSVKIKDMSLPDNCVVCPLCLLDSYGWKRFCFATGKEIDISWDSSGRSDDCPMEEVED
jgi:hypothetical protein